METPKEERARKKAEEFIQKLTEAKAIILPDLEILLESLANESERSAVVLGAERINLALTSLLTRFLRPFAGEAKKDRLFASEGAPLGTFSGKTEVAYRLGLMDLKFKQAIDIVRKLRNDFAHATKVESLQDKCHAERVKALEKLVEGGNQHHFLNFRPSFRKAGEHAQAYLICVLILALKLEMVSYHLERPDIPMPALLDYGAKDAKGLMPS